MATTTKIQDIATGIVSAGSAAVPVVGAVTTVFGLASDLLNGPPSSWTDQTAHQWWTRWGPEKFLAYCRLNGVNVNDLGAVWPAYALWLQSGARNGGGPDADDPFGPWLKARLGTDSPQNRSRAEVLAAVQGTNIPPQTVGETINEVADKADAGRPLTKEERDLLNAAANAGKGTSGAPNMADFGGTGVKIILALFVLGLIAKFATGR